MEAPNILSRRSSQSVADGESEHELEEKSPPSVASHSPTDSSLLDRGGTPTPTPMEASPPEYLTWDGPNDPENPFNWSVAYKCWSTAVIIALCLASSVSSPSSGLYSSLCAIIVYAIFPLL